MLILRNPYPDAAGGGPPLTNLIRWYKADSLSLSNGDPVPSWADSSGTDSPATAAGSARPTYHTGGPNGLPYLSFDGSAQELTLATLPTDGPITLIAVLNASGASGYTFFLALQKHLFGHLTGGGALPNGGWGGYYSGNAFSGVDINDGVWRVLSAVVRNYNDLDLAINGGGAINVTYGNSYGGESTACIGGRAGLQYWPGQTGELLLYTGAGSPAAAVAYARAKWGI